MGEGRGGRERGAGRMGEGGGKGGGEGGRGGGGEGTMTNTYPLNDTLYSEIPCINPERVPHDNYNVIQ